MSRATIVRFAAFVVASAFLTTWIASEIRGSDPAAAVAVTARFGDVSGLVAGDDVRMAGIPVGRVQAVTVEDGQALVSMRIEESADVPASSSAAVRWRNLIGQRYISIIPGSGSAAIEDGSEIDATEDVVDLGRIVNQLAPLAQSFGAEQVNRVLQALVVAFDGNEAAFDALLADLGSLSGVLADRDQLLAQMQADYATIGGALAERDEQVAAMVANVDAIVGALDSSDQILTRALDELGTFSVATDQLLDRTVADLTQVLEALPIVTGAIADDLDVVARAIGGLPAMMDAVLPTINRGPYLRVNLLCLSVGPGACPHPLLFFEDEGA